MPRVYAGRKMAGLPADGWCVNPSNGRTVGVMARRWQWNYWIFGYFLSLVPLVWVLANFRQNVLVSYQEGVVAEVAVPDGSLQVISDDGGMTVEQRRWQDRLAAKKSPAAVESKSAPLRGQPPALVWFGFGFVRIVIVAIALWTVIYTMLFFALQGILGCRNHSVGTAALHPRDFGNDVQ